MQLDGSTTLPVAREAVWRGLNDPAVLKFCIPGCKSFLPTSDGYGVVVTASIGPISAEFFGLIRVTRQIEFEELCLAFEGKGGVAGFVKGTATVILSAKSAVLTQLRYSTSSQIGGRLAQVGSRLVEGVVRRTSESFFTNLVQNLVATNADEGSNST